VGARGRRSIERGEAAHRPRLDGVRAPRSGSRGRRKGEAEVPDSGLTLEPLRWPLLKTNRRYAPRGAPHRCEGTRCRCTLGGLSIRACRRSTVAATVNGARRASLPRGPGRVGGDDSGSAEISAPPVAQALSYIAWRCIDVDQGHCRFAPILTMPGNVHSEIRRVYFRPRIQTPCDLPPVSDRS